MSDFNYFASAIRNMKEFINRPATGNGMRLSWYQVEAVLDRLEKLEAVAEATRRDHDARELAKDLALDKFDRFERGDE